MLAGKLSKMARFVLAGSLIGSKRAQRTIARASRRAHMAINQVTVAERAEDGCGADCRASAAWSVAGWLDTGGMFDCVAGVSVFTGRTMCLLCASLSGETVGDGGGGGASPR